PCLPSFTKSSHCSVPVTLPSPHTIGMHAPPIAGQMAFGTMVQVGLHPCAPSTNTSSHCSAPARTPSPHRLPTHGALAVGHLHPSSTWQTAEHPSPPVELPSSHASPASTTPLPHWGGGGGGVKTHGLPGTLQVKFGSVWQLLEQPSPEK